MTTQPAPDGAEDFTARFSITGAADPQVLPRVIDVLGKYGLVPRLCHAAADDAGLKIDVEIAGAQRTVVDRMLADFRRVIGIERVLSTDAAARLSA